MNQEIDFSTLTWVKNELDVTLNEARQSLEAHVENPQDSAQLGFLGAQLHQVYGTLQMVGLYGASLLLEEMELVARALADQQVNQTDDACEVLMRSILQVPDYLDRLIAGYRDIPLVLLPILNDLRALRGEKLLSESSMFCPDLGASLPDSVTAAHIEGDVCQAARKFRHQYQLGLLGLIRGENIVASLHSMADVLGHLQSSSVSDPAMRLWWVGAAVIDALSEDVLETSVAVKLLFGQIDRQIKRVMDEGEAFFARPGDKSADLLRNLLFYAARSHGGGPRVSEVQAVFRLKDLLPGDEELAAARESLSGQNADLFATVAIAVKEELARLKDGLDIVLRGKGDDEDHLQSLNEMLRSLGDTLGMLSLGSARKAVLARATQLQGYIDSGETLPETVLMDVAGTLLFVESAVDGMGQGKMPSDAAESEVKQCLAERELDQVMDAVLQEAISDLTRAKEAIVEFIDADHQVDVLVDVPKLFNQVKGGLKLLGETRAANLIGSAGNYVERELIVRQKKPEENELDALADAISGIEYYLEGRKCRHLYGSSAIKVAEASVDRLGYLDSDEAREEAPADATGLSEASLDTAVTEESATAAPDEPVADPVPVLSFADLENAVEQEGSTEESTEEVEPEWNLADDFSFEEVELAEQEVEPASEEEAVECEPVVQAEDDGLAVPGDDIDEEILEIFTEEAEEELESINTQLPLWLSNPEDNDALTTLRRSFHTLKGSGRLVGATRIGEFSWAFENMLNAVMDGKIEVSDELTGVMEQGRDVLADLVGQIRDGSPVNQPVTWLMSCADALSKGEEIPSCENAFPVQACNEDEVSVEPEPDATVPLDAGIHADSSEVTRVDVASADAANDGDATADQCLNENVMDDALYGIFSTETRTHLDVLESFIHQALEGNRNVTEELARAMHTLHGSANMAGVGAIADFSGTLERYTRVYHDTDQPISDEGIVALQESYALVDTMMNGLPDPVTEPDALANVASRLISMCDQALDAPSSRETDEQQTVVDEETVPEAEENLSDEESVVTSDCAAEEEDPYADLDQELLEVFLEEALENLEASDTSLAAWRESGSDLEALSALQRALHTLKGGARMADLGTIGDLAHAVESLVIAIDAGREGAGGEALDAVQLAQDQLVSMIEAVQSRQAIVPVDELLARLDALRQQIPADDESREPAEDTASTARNKSCESPASDMYAGIDAELLGVFLEEACDILTNSEQTLQNWKQSPEETSLMVELQRELHTLKGGARMADIDAIGDLAHAVESLMVGVADGERAVDAAIFSVLEQAQDRLTGMIDQVQNRESVTADAELLQNLETLREGGQVAVEESKAAPVAVQANDDPERRSRSRVSQELVRIRAGLLDNLVNHAGEVSIYRSRLDQQIGSYRYNLVEMEQTVVRLREQLRKMEIETEAQVLFRYEQEAQDSDSEFDPLEMDRYSHIQQLSRSLVESVSDLSSIQGMLENITRESETLLLQQSRVNTELQEGLMRTRMVPFIGLAPRMRRIIRQTCQEVGKQAELELSGAEGEMDRTVIDRIIAPLEHMLRNAISHGIETPEQRVAAGKPGTGVIRITLQRESSDVVLRISDDGAGINLDAIREKAIERGLMEQDATLTDNEVLQFILESGFSTAEKVSQVAGRGVGMDVVNSEVKQLGGRLHIDSVAGEGTTFVVNLPFTVAVNQALLVEVGEDVYAVPLTSVEGIVRMRREELKSYYDNPSARFSYGGYEYEVCHLGSIMGTGQPGLDAASGRLPILLSRSGDHCVALQVENLLGSREVVVKSVGTQISTVRGVSGATILGDGRVVMILDVAPLLRGGVSMMGQIEAMQQPTRSEGITVMVVDDSITVRKVTTRLLERNDMKVISAKDGVDAVARLQEHLPDIMLLDIEMPRMDGFELATHIRNEARLRDIPIVMITSRTGDKHRQRAMEIGVNRYLGKPFQEKDLLENITELLVEQTKNA